MVPPLVAGMIKKFPKLFGPTQKLLRRKVILFRVVAASYRQKVWSYHCERGKVCYLLSINGAWSQSFSPLVGIPQKVLCTNRHA